MAVPPLPLQPEEVVRVCTQAIDRASDELRHLNLEVRTTALLCRQTQGAATSNIVW